MQKRQRRSTSTFVDSRFAARYHAFSWLDCKGHGSQVSPDQICSYGGETGLIGDFTAVRCGAIHTNRMFTILAIGIHTLTHMAISNYVHGPGRENHLHKIMRSLQASALLGITTLFLDLQNTWRHSEFNIAKGNMRNKSVTSHVSQHGTIHHRRAPHTVPQE